MSQNYFTCPRCGTIHDVDPKPSGSFTALSSSGQDAPLSRVKPEFDSPQSYPLAASRVPDPSFKKVEERLGTVIASEDWADAAEIRDWYIRDVVLLLEHLRAVSRVPDPPTTNNQGDVPRVDGERDAPAAGSTAHTATSDAPTLADRPLSWRLGCMADAVLSAKVGPQARFFTRACVDDIVLLLREAEKALVNQ